MDEWYLGECFLCYPKTLFKKPERKKVLHDQERKNRENLTRGQKSNSIPKTWIELADKKSILEKS
jgi:hypothetical protein